MPPRNSDYLLYLVLASLWGASFVAIKFVVGAFPPFFAAMLRTGSAFLFLAIFFRLSSRSMAVPFAIRWRMWVIGLIALAIPQSFLFWGERLISAGLAGILNGTVPIWTFILSLLFWWQIPAGFWRKVIGLLLGIAGVVIIFWPMLRFGESSHELLGTLAVCMMALFYGIGNLMNQKLLSSDKAISFHSNVYHQFFASSIFLLVLSLSFEHWPAWSVITNSIPALGTSIFLGIFSTAIAFLIFYYLIREWGAIHASTVLYLVPILALVWDFVFFRIYPTWYEVFGVIAILVGVVIIQFTRIKKEPVKK